MNLPAPGGNAPSDPLKIGPVTPAWPRPATPNGIASATSQLAAGLEAIGHEVTTLTLRLDAPTDHPLGIDAPDTGMSLLQWLIFRLSPDRAKRQRRRAGPRSGGADLFALSRVGVWRYDDTARLRLRMIGI